MGGLGALGSVELLERKADGEMRTYRYRFVYPDTALLVMAKFDKANKLDQFGLSSE